MLRPGDSAPPFDLPAATGDRVGRVTLSKLGDELIVLFFYPRDFSFICPTEVTSFNQSLGLFRAEKTAVIGASIDNAESHRQWSHELGGLELPLAADEDGSVATAYGVFDGQEKVAMRATFIIDQARKIAFSQACPINIGRGVAEILRIVRALRTNRLCPADWTPGGGFGPAGWKF
ncbi:MAG TPA: redoxin domain-containing protein [Candidatus Binataceae bacterium]|nr:redoxin domain-containing protein [Candidatus Binataceae bacterium]